MTSRMDEATRNGSTPISVSRIIVEGASDQLYLSAMKNYLVGQGLIQPHRDFLYISAGGTKGVSTVADIFTSPEDAPPPVLLDADNAGLNKAESLKKNNTRYAANPDRIILVNQFSDLTDPETEDLWPTDQLITIISRTFRGSSEDFDEFHQSSYPMVPQVEAYARKHNLELEEGWKVRVAEDAKQRLLRNPSALPSDSELAKKWVQLFNILSG